MVLGVGSALREYDSQYKAVRDEHGVWRVLDRWHPDLSMFGPEDDIPDDHPAVKLLLEGEFLALVHEMKVLGYIQRLEEDDSFTVSSEAYEAVVEENKRLKEEHNYSEGAALPKADSEEFRLSNKKLELIEKLNLGKDDLEVIQEILSL